MFASNTIKTLKVIIKFFVHYGRNSMLKIEQTKILKCCTLLLKQLTDFLPI